MKMSFENYNTKTCVEIPNDSSLDAIFDAIKGQLVTLTWSESMIEDFILEKAEEIKDSREFDKQLKKSQDESED
jgi:uncharacterized protein YeeX (DUF496 family)